MTLLPVQQYAHRKEQTIDKHIACGVAEHHQTKNAMALVNKNAALYVKDADAPAEVVKLALQTVKDDARLKELSENILKLALPDSADIIANEVVKLARRGH